MSKIIYQRTGISKTGTDYALSVLSDTTGVELAVTLKRDGSYNVTSVIALSNDDAQTLVDSITSHLTK